jgi:hypothetical protein
LLERYNLKGHSLPRWTKTGLAILLSLSPALLVARLISRYGVDIPYADEWLWTPFLFKAHEHSLTVADFFAQHNEHRYFFPKLLLLILAPLTSGNTRGAMFFSLGLAALTSAALWYLLNRTVPITTNKKLLLLTLFNLVLFSPVQSENWMWGYQFVLFFSNLLLVAGICVSISRRSLRTKFFLSFAIASVATFSFGGGIVAWPFTFPLALAIEPRLTKRKIILWLSAWLCAAGAAVLLYFFHYTKPPVHPPLFASSQPGDYFFYLTAFLGGQFSKLDQTESILLAVENGTLLLLLYLGGLFWTIRSQDADFRKKMLPWLGLGGFAILNAFLAAATRIGFGVNQSLDSRYTTVSLFISLSVIGMFAVTTTTCLNRQANRPAFGLKWIGIAWLLTACPTLLLIGHLNASWWGIASMQQSRNNRLHGKAALLFTNVLDAGEVHSKYLIANATQTRPWANMANTLGFLHPPLFQGPELSRIDNRPQMAGFLEKLTAKKEGAWEATGWAIIPKGFRPADAVLLAYDDPAKGKTAFAIAAPMAPRSYVVDALHDARYEYSGWSCDFERSIIPTGNQAITAWAFDAEKMRLYPLGTPKTVH